MSLAEKYALVTGSSRGIGRGIALKLAEKRARVAVHCHKNEAAAQATLAKVREIGSDGFLVRGDVCHPEEISQILGRVKTEFGRLDILVHNARPDLTGFYSGPLNITLDQWDTALNSQAKAFLIAVQEASQLMPDGGRILAITYTPGGRFGSWQPWVAMGSGKAAMESLCRYFAVALAKRRITVNAISPGWIEDSVLNTLPPEAQQRIREWHEGGWIPMGHLGTPADIGNAVLLLCSEEAGWITGQTLTVDGGASLMETIMPLDMQGVAPKAAKAA